MQNFVPIVNILKFKNLRFIDVDKSDKMIATYTPTEFDDINNVYYCCLTDEGIRENDLMKSYKNLLLNYIDIYGDDKTYSLFMEYNDKKIFPLKKKYAFEYKIIDTEYYKTINKKFLVYKNIFKNGLLDYFDIYDKFDNTLDGCMFMSKQKIDFNKYKNLYICDMNSPEIRLFFYLFYNKIFDGDVYEALMKNFSISNIDRDAFKKEIIRIFYGDIGKFSNLEYLVGNSGNFTNFLNQINDGKKSILDKFNGRFITDLNGRIVNVLQEDDKIDSSKLSRRIFATFLQSSVTNINFDIAYDYLMSGCDILYISREECIFTSNYDISGEYSYKNFMQYRIDRIL